MNMDILDITILHLSLWFGIMALICVAACKESPSSEALSSDLDTAEIGRPQDIFLGMGFLLVAACSIFGCLRHCGFRLKYRVSYLKKQNIVQKEKSHYTYREARHKNTAYTKSLGSTTSLKVDTAMSRHHNSYNSNDHTVPTHPNSMAPAVTVSGTFPRKSMITVPSHSHEKINLIGKDKPRGRRYHGTRVRQGHKTDTHWHRRPRPHSIVNTYAYKAEIELQKRNTRVLGYQKKAYNAVAGSGRRRRRARFNTPKTRYIRVRRLGLPTMYKGSTHNRMRGHRQLGNGPGRLHEHISTYFDI